MLIITIIEYKRRTFLFYIDLFLVIILLIDLRNNFQWNSGSAPGSVKSFKVINYNVAGFVKHPENAAKISDMLKEQHADIVCMQEYGFYDVTLGLKDTLSSYFSKELKMPYYKWFRQRDNDFGLIIFSKYKFVKDSALFLHEKVMNAGVYCELDVEGKRLGILNFQLYSYNLNNQPYIPILSLLRKTRQINHIFQYVYKEQEKEVQILLAKARSLSFPVILAGDFNNIPNSYFYHQLASSFNDSFMEKGRGRGITYPLMGIGIRIDYQFSSKNLKVLEHKVLESNFSDHYALAVRYCFP